MSAEEKSRPKVFTVSEFNRSAQKLLEEHFSEIWIEGEISNFRGAASSGHCYFSLKDETAQVDIVAFRGVMNTLRFKLEDGLKVLILGRASLYPQRGRFQIVAAFIEPKGAGALQLAFEQLKKKLEAEGLFDPARKKAIPALPRKIGIVTSPTGAALRDILTVIDRRFANVEILIYPTKVQGEGAKEEIAEGVRYLNDNHSDLDVLLVGRGGGSIEDLWAFNEEIVARAIAGSQIPVISCVGHEIDFTIADFVADLRAPTPSAAAELVVRNKMELARTLEHHFSRIRQSLLALVGFHSERLKGLLRTAAFLRPDALWSERAQTLDHLFAKLALLSPRSLLEKQSESLRLLGEKLNERLRQNRDNLAQSLALLAGRLEALSPLAVLERGYAIAWALPQGTILKSASQLKKNDAIRVRLHAGEIRALVQETSALPAVQGALFPSEANHDKEGQRSGK